MPTAAPAGGEGEPPMQPNPALAAQLAMGEPEKSEWHSIAFPPRLQPPPMNSRGPVKDVPGPASCCWSRFLVCQSADRATQ
jgi:hypothetical protein